MQPITASFFCSAGWRISRAGLGSPAAQIIDKPFYEAVESSHQLADRFRGQISGFFIISQAMTGTWQKVVAEHSEGYPFLLISQIGLVLLAGLLFRIISLQTTASSLYLYKQFLFRGLCLQADAYMPGSKPGRSVPAFFCTAYVLVSLF